MYYIYTTCAKMSASDSCVCQWKYDTRGVAFSSAYLPCANNCIGKCRARVQRAHFKRNNPSRRLTETDRIFLHPVRHVNPQRAENVYQRNRQRKSAFSRALRQHCGARARPVSVCVHRAVTAKPTHSHTYPHQTRRAHTRDTHILEKNK